MYVPIFWKINKKFLIHTMGFINFRKKEVMLLHPVESKNIICIDTDENSPFAENALQHSTRQLHTCLNEA